MSAKKSLPSNRNASGQKSPSPPARKGAVHAKSVVAKKSHTPPATSATPRATEAKGAPSGKKQQVKQEETVVADTRPKSRRGQPIGRPKTRLEELKAMPTRCPTHIYTYLKGITPFLYPSLTVMFEDMLRRFLKERPWERGLHWRKPKTAMTFAGGMAGKTGWEQVNLQLPQELAMQVVETAKVCGVSGAALCYTAIFWWVQYIYPPAKVTAGQLK